MSKVIFKSMYLKSAEGGIKHALNLVEYVARREGVIASESFHLEGDATFNQQHLINEISNIIDLDNNILFKQFALFPTKENASRVITDGLKQINAGGECITDPQILLDYIAERPGVLNSKCEEIQHGLFDLNGDVESITKTKREMMNSGSNIHHHIISIKLEDAFDIGMDNKESWESLVRRTAVKLAKESNISFKDLGLVGAVHQNKTSFHVHLMQYSKSNDRNMYFTDKGLEHLRKTITKDVYQNQILDIANKRDDFFKLEITPKMLDEINDELTGLLRDHLGENKGRMFYGYLDNETKIEVSQILDKVFKSNEELSIRLENYLEQQIKYRELFNKIDDRDKLKNEIYQNLLFPRKIDKSTFQNKLINVILSTKTNKENSVVSTVYEDYPDINKLEQELYDQLSIQDGLNNVTINSNDINKNIQDVYFNSNIFNLESNELKIQLKYQVSNNKIDDSIAKQYKLLGKLDNQNYQIKHSDKYLLLFANALKTETYKQKQTNEVIRNRKRKKTRRKTKKRESNIKR